jgi:multiple sugar transport system ATP-binding protein
MPRVVLEDVHKKFGRSQEAVQGVSFTCNDGEFLVLLGPSGCGKTTTLRMICGLESITSGTIWIGDRVVNNLHPRQRNVAMAFETFALYPPLTAYENIAFPLRVMKRSKEEVDQQVRKVAAALSITECLDRLRNVVKWQKQRVALASVGEPLAF